MVIFWEMNAKRVVSAPLFNSTLEHFHLTVCIVTSLFVLSPHCLYCHLTVCIASTWIVQKIFNKIMNIEETIYIKDNLEIHSICCKRTYVEVKVVMSLVQCKLHTFSS